MVVSQSPLISEKSFPLCTSSVKSRVLIQIMCRGQTFLGCSEVCVGSRRCPGTMTSFALVLMRIVKRAKPVSVFESELWLMVAG